MAIIFVNMKIVFFFFKTFYNICRELKLSALVHNAFEYLYLFLVKNFILKKKTVSISVRMFTSRLMQLLPLLFTISNTRYITKLVQN